MNTNPNILPAEALRQCPHCLRYVCGGQVVALSLGEAAAAVREDRLVSAACGLEDCAEVVSLNCQRDQARRERRMANRRERHEAKQECRQQRDQRDAGLHRGKTPAEARMPYKDPEPDEPATCNLQPAPAIGTNVGTVIEHSLSQHEFVASGQADSQNAKLLEFFSAPKNFNKWFKSTFLEELSGATRMNNRAVDLRPAFIERGHYIDNCMMTDTHTDRKASYYRVCNIEHAVSLTAEQKLKLTSA